MPNLAFIPTALAGAIVMDIYHTRRYQEARAGRHQLRQ